MKIETVTRDEVTIVEICGSLDATTAPRVQEETMPLVEPNCVLIFDMGQCHYISSAGLRVLLMIGKLATTKGGNVVLAGLSEEIRDMMEITGFDHMFKTYDTVSAASGAICGEKA